MKKILVATDYSKEARHALLFALGMARREKAEIVLFHAFNQPLSVANAFRLDEAISGLEREKACHLEEYAQAVQFDANKDFVLQFQSTREADGKEKGKASLTKTGNHVINPAKGAAVKIICVCKFGLPEETILVAAEAYGADLVIMGMRGAGPVSQAFLGSAVTGVIQAGKVPVLALPWQAKLKERPTFVFALDLGAVPDPVNLRRLRSWVKLFGADLKILHLYRENDPQQEQQKALAALECLDKELPDITYAVYFQQRNDITTGIREFVRAQQADLLTLVPKHHTFLEILLQDTITGSLREQAAIPLLTLPYTPVAEQVALKDKKTSQKPLPSQPGKD
jgi:nucleotide-binding universal stress UspA family protein